MNPHALPCDIKYGDLVEVEIWVDGQVVKKLCKFIEAVYPDTYWFSFVCEGDSIRGDDTFSSDWMAFVDVSRYIGKETPDMFCGEHI